MQVIEEQLERLKKAVGVSSDTAFAQFMEMSQGSISGAKKKGQLPHAWFFYVSEKTGVSSDWLFFGTGSMHPGEQPDLQPESASNTPELCARCSGLEAENKLLREFKASQDETIKAQAETIRMYKIALETAQQEAFKGDRGIPAVPPSARTAPTSTEINK